MARRAAEAVFADSGTAADSFFAESISVTWATLSEGDHCVGLCAAEQSDVENGLANVTIAMAETSGGVTYDGLKAAPRRPARQ